MRGTLPEAREVLDMHTQVLNDLNVFFIRNFQVYNDFFNSYEFLFQMKGIEIDALLRSVNSLCEMAEEAQAHEVQMKGDLLHDTWQKYFLFTLILLRLLTIN